jgi:PAS domain S-box-containing protein
LSEKGSIFIRALGKKSIAGYALLRDIYGNPALLLRVDKPRVIYEQGEITIHYFILVLVAVGLVSVVVAMLSLDKQVLSRLANISKTVGSIGTSGNFSRRVSIGGRDELSNLARNINGMLEKIDQSQKALRASEKKYRELVENANTIILRIDTDGRITFFNEFAQSFFGYSGDEILGKNVVGTIMPERDSSGLDFMAMIEDIGRNPERYTNYESENIRRNGERVWIIWTNKAIYDKDGRVTEILCVGNDITERKRMEAELLKAQKLESIGILAGGIAHDFNNLLMAILGNITLAKMYSTPEDKVFANLIEAEKASLRAKDLTQQLLTFSKGGAPIKKTASIAELLKDSATFALRGSNVRCEFCLPDDLWPAEVDEGQISQVINNLIINADQAMPEGGVIKVRAENMTVKPEHNLPLKEGKYIKITIEDQGTGISKEHLPKIFDPYFTTKQKGSGLGLATAYSIIKRHDGYISVESELGVGTTFHIYLPASEKELLKKKDEKERLFVGKGKILVMDDEEAVREVVGNMLKFLGYKVEFARDGTEAIELYKKAKESEKPFDAVILDLTVPGGMGGREAIQKLLEIDPKVKAIVSSGYSNDPIMSDFKKYGFRGVVAKPYKVKELSEELHKVMMGKDLPR